MLQVRPEGALNMTSGAAPYCLGESRVPYTYAGGWSIPLPEQAGLEAFPMPLRSVKLTDHAWS